jgi:hypothetical protein
MIDVSGDTGQATDPAGRLELDLACGMTLNLKTEGYARSD